MTSTSSPGRPRFPLALPPWTQLRRAMADSVVVGLSCLLTYWLATTILAHVYSPSAADDELGGLWAVIATVFVLRETYDKSVAAAVSRIGATLVSLALCLVYLAFLPFHLWSLAVLTGLSGLVASLIGRPEDSITAAITTTVVLIVAEVSPHDAWTQPILRLADTVIGVAVGLAAAWLVRRASGRSQPTAEASGNGTGGPRRGRPGGEQALTDDARSGPAMPTARATSGLTVRGNRTCTPDRGRRERLEAGIRPWRRPDTQNRLSAPLSRS